MQKLHELRIPEGRKAFASLLFANFGKKEVLFDTFLANAHKYRDEEMAQALRSVLSLSQSDIRKWVRGVKHPASLITRSAVIPSDMESMLCEAKNFVIARNAYIPYYIIERPYSDHVLDAYQDVCRKLVECSNNTLKAAYLDMAGMMGNALPLEEKAKLAGFLVDYLMAEDDRVLKVAATCALAMLLNPQAPLAIMHEAERSGDENYQVVAYRAAVLAAAIKAPKTLEVLLPGFLFGNMGADVKVAAASLMLSLGNAGLYSSVMSYMKTVGETVDELHRFALRKADEELGADSPERVERANSLLLEFYKSSGFHNDVAAYSALAGNPKIPRSGMKAGRG